MDALLGPDEIRLRESVRAWARREFGSAARPFGPGSGFPPDLVEKLVLQAREAGLHWPASDPRAPALEPVIFLEGVSLELPEAGFRLAEHAALCIPFIMSFGRPEQQERYLPPLVAGRSTGAWLWVETREALSRPDGWFVTPAVPISGAGPVLETAVILTPIENGASGPALEGFVFDQNDVCHKAGGETGFLLPPSCRLAVGGHGFQAAREVIRTSSAVLLGCLIGAAAGLLDECYHTARARGAFETLILDARDIQVRLSEARAELEALRWLTYRTLIRGTSGPWNEESARLVVEMVRLATGLLDLGARLSVRGWNPVPPAAGDVGARRALALMTSLGHILL